MTGYNNKQIDGLKNFYWEAGELEDSFYLIAPDYPGFGNTYLHPKT